MTKAHDKYEASLKAAYQKYTNTLTEAGRILNLEVEKAVLAFEARLKK